MGHEYDVGYGKPPKHSQFSKGKSGNPKGRPKKTVTPLDRIERLLNQTIKWRRNGKVEHIPLEEAILSVISAMALKGDVKAARYLDKRQARLSGRQATLQPQGGVIHVYPGDLPGW